MSEALLCAAGTEALPGLLLGLRLNFDVDTRRKVETHERIDGFIGWLTDVDESLVNAHLILIARIFVNEGGSVHRVLSLLGWKRDGTEDLCSGALSRLHDRLSRLVNDLVIVCANLNADSRLVFLFSFFC